MMASSTRPVSSKLMHASLRYAMAASGPVATAGAHFVLSLFLLRVLAPDAFGQISFLLIVSQLSSGLWSALFCAPLPVLLAQAGTQSVDGVQGVRRCMFATNLAAAGVALLLFSVIACIIGLPPGAAILFAAYAACFLLRWLARSDAYAAGEPGRVVASDLGYGAVLLVGLWIIQVYPGTSLAATCAVLLVAALSSLLSFGWRYLSFQFLRPRLADIRAYGRVWRAHSRWSLAGVLTTEVTVNSHAYLLTIAFGAAAFAPVAASALLIRPIGVVVNALTEFERPQLAARIGLGDFTGAIASMRLFRLVSTLAWAASAIGAACVLHLAPRLIFPPLYDLDFMIAGTGLWMAVALIRQWRAPESILLQACGEFRALAQASFVSAVVSVAAVAAFLWLSGPLLSILGILAGETVCAAWTWRQARRIRQQTTLTEVPP